MSERYRSFAYLGDEEDYIPYRLEPELGRVPVIDLGLSDAEMARAEALLKKSPVISLHDEPVRFPVELGKLGTIFGLVGSTQRMKGYALRASRRSLTT
jgi:hypothetical protein